MLSTFASSFVQNEGIITYTLFRPPV